jgi:dTDP-4-amino-4,6-dideoxygalactose transaminase
MDSIEFNIPYTTEESINNIKRLIEDPCLVNQTNYLRKCKEWFEANWPGYCAFMTTSCTRALELIALSMNLKEGDEIILSPYNYVGVGNAFANYGAKLVFVDIDAQTMNINADLIEAAITDKTRAIVAMHYASIPCDMEVLTGICNKYNLTLIEDNAQGIHNSYNNFPLGSFGDFSCISFDMLKNISCHEGGVLLCKEKWKDSVDIAYNNGTNKTLFSKGLVDKYEWISRGSKFTMSEYVAAVLFPLLEKSKHIINERKKIWNSLYDKIAKDEILRELIPDILLNVPHNGHLAYLKFRNQEQRNIVLYYLNNNGVPSSFHYIPLDTSLAYKNNAISHSNCFYAFQESRCLLRLPMHNFLTEDHQSRIISILKSAVVLS